MKNNQNHEQEVMSEEQKKYLRKKEKIMRENNLRKQQINRKRAFIESIKINNKLFTSTSYTNIPPLMKIHYDELKDNKEEIKRKINEIMNDESNKKINKIRDKILQYYIPKASSLSGIDISIMKKTLVNEEDEAVKLFVNNLVESSLNYLDDKNADSHFKTNTTNNNYNEINLENPKFILSKYGWKHDKSTSARHNCLLYSVEEFNLEGVNRALLFVGRVHKAQPDVVSACNEDLKWIEENWDEGDNIKKIIEIRKKKKEEKSAKEKKYLAPLNKNAQKRKLEVPSSKSKKNIDNISIMTNPKTIRRFFKNYNENNPCKVKMKAIDFIEYSSGKGLKEMYQKDVFDKKRLLEKSLLESTIKNAFLIVENREYYIVIIQ